MEQLFTINGRFKINPALNLVQDTALEKEIRLEPRLMQLLCILADQVGELVFREQLVKEIWNDYGGADDGLTQSVSVLRKVLLDGEKKMIETIPKKGYVLHASITQPAEEPVVRPIQKKENKAWVWSLAGCLVLLLTGFLLFAGQGKFSKSQMNAVQPKKEMSVPFQEVNKEDEENYLNTVTTIGPDSAQFKLVVIGDRRPKFYINEKLLTPTEMEDHLPLISRLNEQLQQRKAAHKLREE